MGSGHSCVPAGAGPRDACARPGGWARRSRRRSRCAHQARGAGHVEAPSSVHDERERRARPRVRHGACRRPLPGVLEAVRQGKKLFTSAGCSGCRTLADAGATGQNRSQSRRDEADGRPRRRGRRARRRRDALLRRSAFLGEIKTVGRLRRKPPINNARARVRPEQPGSLSCARSCPSPSLWPIHQSAYPCTGSPSSAIPRSLRLTPQTTPRIRSREGFGRGASARKVSTSVSASSCAFSASWL